MVEGEWQLSPIADPFGRDGIRARLWLGCLQQGQIGHADGMATRIPVGIGIDADQAQGGGIDAGFFLQLAAARALHRFARFNKATGKRIGAFIRRVPSTDQQHMSARIEGSAVGCQNRPTGHAHFVSLQPVSAILRYALTEIYLTLL